MDFLRLGVDLLDLYRGALPLRRVCVIVAHLPPDAALWRVLHPDGRWTRAEVLAAATERRITALWAAVVTLLGHKVGDDELISPLDVLTSTAIPGAETPPAARGGDSGTPTTPLREIALMMREA
ncbi:hypothetical protein ACQPW3_13505 [Actinosynnema sp. CA-248983]